MRKLAAIFLLIIFLFNLGGYRFWFYYNQQQSDKHLEALLDKNQYNEDDLIIIKIPLSMPYQIDRQQFERVDGEINLHGKIYKYVKRKVQEGDLILLCLPDNNKMRIENAKEDFFKNTNDLTQNNQSNKSNSKAIGYKNLLSEYDQHSFTLKSHTNEINIESLYFIKDINQLLSAPRTPPCQPPDLVVS